MSTPTKKEKAAAEKARLKEIARKAAHKAPPESSRAIVALGQERLKALQTGGIALDTRTTQVAAFQLAAAAVAASLTASENVTALGAAFAALACLAFFVGSSLAFWGMRCCDTQVAGVDPSFWTGVLSIPRLTDKVGRSWAADVTEDCIFEARAVDVTRGQWLNRSLIAGIIGGAAVLASGASNALDRWTPPAAGPSPILVGHQTAQPPEQAGAAAAPAIPPQQRKKEAANATSTSTSGQPDTPSPGRP